MTSKVRRIRYKRCLILRPSIVVKRVKFLEKNITQVPQVETVEPVSFASLPPAITTTDMNEKTVAQLSDQLASFKIEEDPYAYFVSQLPNMLSAIPNLLVDPISQTENDTTDKASIRENSDELQTVKQETDGHSVWPIADKISSVMPVSVTAFSHSEQTVPNHKYDPFKKNALIPIGIDWNVKQDKDMQDWLSLINPGRHLLWSGLPRKSCQQIRFGGQKEILKSAGVTDPDFLFSQLSALAEQRKCSVLWLLLLLSPVDRVRHFLAEQPLQDICRHCFNMPEIALPELTLHYYLQHLIASDQLQVNLACFTQLVPSLICTDKINFTSDQLAIFFNRRFKTSENGLFKLTMKRQVIYIEMKAGQVQVYNGKGEPVVWAYRYFLEHIKLSQFNNNNDISCEIFNLPSDFRQQLAGKLQKREQQWQGHWQRHLYEFIILPEALIDTTKLY